MEYRSVHFRSKASDLILLVGGRMSEIASQSYTLLDIPTPKQQLVHVHPDVGELNRVYRANLAIAASPIAFATALSSVKATPVAQRAQHLQTLRSSYLAWSEIGRAHV